MTKFVIGIGSQRAGSTLLHRILDECSSIFMHPVKELHYFDTMFSVRNENVLHKYSKRQLEKEKNKLRKSIKRFSRKYQCYLRTNQLLSSKKVSEIEYFDLFTPCRTASEYLGEITPEYMILPDEGVKYMSSVLGRDTKIILIARHPVQRFISSVKLLKAYNCENVSPEQFENELLKIMNVMPKWMKVQDSFNDYESALTRYQKYFDNVLFLSFDNLTQKLTDTHFLLESFLDISISKNKYQTILKTKINAINETSYVSEAVKKVLEIRYKESIDFLDTYFGEKFCVT